MKWLVLLLCLAVARAQTAVKVSVFYESLCPDSIRFFKYQLYPSWLQLSQDYMLVDLVPYGKASQTRSSNGTWSFQCQHGPQECRGNMEQACAVSLLSHNTSVLVPFISCVMSTLAPNTQQCAQGLGVNYSDIESCANSPQGGDLLAAYGDRTHNFPHRITFVPTVVLNDVYNQRDQDMSLNDLLSVVCRHITGVKPSVCSQ